MTLYEPAWERWLKHKDSCKDCSAASVRPRSLDLAATWCATGIVMLQRLEEIARLEDDE